MTKVTVSVQQFANLSRVTIQARRGGDNGTLVENIEVPVSRMVTVRNQMVERLSEEYDEVVARPLPTIHPIQGAK